MPFQVDIRFVNRTEEQLGVRFPPEYVVRMSRENGGTIEAADDVWWLHPIFDDSDRKHLKRTCNDVVRETGRMRELDWFPPGGVALATNGAGEHLILLPRADDLDLLDTTLSIWYLAGGDLEPIGDTSEIL